MPDRERLSGARVTLERMNLQYFLFRLWDIVINHGIPLTALLLLAITVPRISRIIIRIIGERFDEDEEATKTRLALLGALMYVLQVAAYFIIAVFALSNLGVPPLGAAIPATVVSAAIGFGAQNIIGDFLAGFFIISEKQFGVGDYVSFDGPSDTVEGTVVALTLRTTKIRTPRGEVVMIPNGSAGVVTNFSQDWSRAVVDLAIPLQPGETLASLHDRVEETSKKAVQDPSIAGDIAGEVEVLPATGLVAPTAASQPWQVTFRTLVVVNPARQWAVERGIRAALVDTFWDHFELPENSVFMVPQETPPPADAPTKLILSAQHAAVREAEKDAELADAPTASSPGATALSESVAAGTKASQPETDVPIVSKSSADHSDAWQSAEARAAAEKDASIEDELAPNSKDDGPGTPATTSTLDATEESSNSMSADGTSDKSSRRGFWRDDSYDSQWKRALSFNGRVRPSTTGLFIGLLVTGLLYLATSNPENGTAGFLNPAYWQKSSTTVTSTAPSTPDVTEPAQSPPQPEPTHPPLTPSEDSLSTPTNESEPLNNATPDPTDTPAPDGAVPSPTVSTNPSAPAAPVPNPNGTTGTNNGANPTPAPTGTNGATSNLNGTNGTGNAGNTPRYSKNTLSSQYKVSFIS
ncbi:MAG: mechanosensitive ion channel [Corynebacterium sp.]|nr:mechanosensitive ion channel [Corynebacterium sp.]